MLRKSRSLKIKIFSLILISKEYYKLLDFEASKVKYLQIDSYMYPYYPVNKFENQMWNFDQKEEGSYDFHKFSLSAYAIFKFLVHSNLIYSIEEIKIVWPWHKDSFEEDFNNLLNEFREILKKPLKVHVHHNLPNFEIININKMLDYYGYCSYNSFTYDKMYETINDRKDIEWIHEDDFDKLLYNSAMEDNAYVTKINELFADLFSRTEFIYEYNLKTFITECYHIITFDYYSDKLYNWTFNVFIRKIDDAKNLHEGNANQNFSNEIDYHLKEQLNSWILGKVLEEGTLVRRHT